MAGFQNESEKTLSPHAALPTSGMGIQESNRTWKKANSSRFPGFDNRKFVSEGLEGRLQICGRPIWKMSVKNRSNQNDAGGVIWTQYHLRQGR